jgi:hypothetical protein
MWEERRLEIPAGASPQELIKVPANAQYFAALGAVEYDGVLQGEACPFHSPSLPRKGALLKTIGEGGLLGSYTEHVRAFLHDRPVLILSAVPSRASLKREVAKMLSPWLRWLAALGGLSQDANFVRFVTKGRTTTAAALVSFEGEAPKALVLMMGGNHLPAEKGLKVLATALRQAERKLAKA